MAFLVDEHKEYKVSGHLVQLLIQTLIVPNTYEALMLFGQIQEYVSQNTDKIKEL